MAREKPTWKKLVYWGGLLFASVIFNMIVYVNNSYSYKLSIDPKGEGIYIFLWLVLVCVIIQLISPSWILGGLVKRIKEASKGKNPSGEENGDSTGSNMIYLKGVPDKSQNMPEKEFEEKDFELFLNTLCYLSFAFVIFVNLLFAVTNDTGLIKGVFAQGHMAGYGNMLQQLNHVAYIMVFLTLPISVRQILFYLWKLRRPSAESKEEAKYNSSRYERYMLVQKHLKQSHRKL